MDDFGSSSMARFTELRAHFPYLIAANELAEMA